MGDIERTEWALRERVKELTCLYGIAHVMQRSDMSLPQALQTIVDLLPPAWQFPEIACARIVMDGKPYETARFRESPRRQAADLAVAGKSRGIVEVFYTHDPCIAEPFLEEERSLIEMIAREVSIHIERCEAEEAGARLRDQLRHADRLATLGQLAAGVAHEINEPLSNILGFAQLAKKHPGVPESVAGDLEKIVKSCLYAREVIHKLLTFARKMPPEKSLVNLNQIVKDGLYFLESRCAKAGIDIVRTLDPDLPAISADRSQLHQVVVNLVVNALQAMADGGTLTIETHASNGNARLIVRDTGTGMTEAVKRNIFTPFFTTKDVNEGTGLGLAVVHGIVAAHGGTIDVSSEPGRGARFTVDEWAKHRKKNRSSSWTIPRIRWRSFNATCRPRAIVCSRHLTWHRRSASWNSPGSTWSSPTSRCRRSAALTW
jgi:signal transduction histidine kinase